VVGESIDMKDEDKTKEQRIMELGEMRAGIAASEKSDAGAEQRAAQEALRESEGRFRDVVEHISAVFWMAKADLSEMIYVSPAYESMWGQSCAGLYENPRSWMDHIHPDDQDRVRAAISQRKDTGHTLEYRIVRLDGAVRWIRDRGFPVSKTDGRSNRIAGIAEDITGLREAEEATQEYTKVIEGSQDLISVVDRGYRYRLANETYLRYRETRREDVIGRSCAEVLGADVFEHTVKNHLDRCFLGETIRYEMKYTYSTLGERDLLVSYFPIKGSKGIDRVVAIMRDLTQNKKFEEALRESETRYRGLFEAMPDGFSSVGMDKRIMEANPAFRAMLGYSLEELYELTYEDLTPAKWHAFEEGILQEQVLARGYSEVYEKEYIRRNGTIFPVEVRAHLLRDENGNAREMWGFLRDITERKRVEDTLQESEEKFRLLFEKSVDPSLLLDGDIFIEWIPEK